MVDLVLGQNATKQNVTGQKSSKIAIFEWYILSLLNIYLKYSLFS